MARSGLVNVRMVLAFLKIADAGTSMRMPMFPENAWRVLTTAGWSPQLTRSAASFGSGCLAHQRNRCVSSTDRSVSAVLIVSSPVAAFARQAPQYLMSLAKPIGRSAIPESAGGSATPPRSARLLGILLFFSHFLKVAWLDAARHHVFNIVSLPADQISNRMSVAVPETSTISQI